MPAGEGIELDASSVEAARAAGAEEEEEALDKNLTTPNEVVGEKCKESANDAQKFTAPPQSQFF